MNYRYLLIAMLIRRSFSECGLAVLALVITFHCTFTHWAAAQDVESQPTASVDPFPATYADPAVPLLQLPTDFRSRRTTANIAAEAGKPIDIFCMEGAGCVRHIWFVFAEKDLDDVEIEIAVDEAPEPQVRIPFRSFFGVLLGFEDYHINSAAVVNYPNFTVTNDPHIPPKASPGWNFYLPIPFSRRCRITIYSKSAKHGAAMVDWQQYREGVEFTPLRFHAQRNLALPASPDKPFPITETEGIGFLAGYIMGWRQKDHGDMVFHNSGTRLLIDGQTDPHVICGCNVEDDFGFSWGFNQYQTRWSGCPYRDNRGRNDQDGVFYRFFGPDPILFRSSLLFTSNARPDDYEAVSYFYRVPASQSPRVTSPAKWAAIGPFPDGKDLNAFQQPADEIVRHLSQPELPRNVTVAGTDYAVHHLESQYGWLRLEHIVQQRPPYPLTEHSFYVRATLHSDTDRKATLRLGLDNWALVWLNSTYITMLDRNAAFDTARIPISLRAGDNYLVIKTNNRQNHERLLWAINCVVK